MQREATVGNEIAALDTHLADLARHIEAIESLRRRRGSRCRNSRTERRHWRELRAMLEDDLRDGPIMRARDGRELTTSDRAIVRHRASEMRE